MQADPCRPLSASQARAQAKYPHDKAGEPSPSRTWPCVPFLPAAASKPRNTVVVKQGNVYPTLSEQQLDAMRQRRLTNYAPDTLLHKEPAAHQAKHIMMCRCVRATGGSSRAPLCSGQLPHLPARRQQAQQPCVDPSTPSPLNKSRCTVLSCMCSGSSCKATSAICKPCGMSANGQRCWEYLSSRLAEINQLRSEDDEQEPILVSKLNCLQVSSSR